MKDELIGNPSDIKGKTDWEQLRGLGDTELRAALEADPDTRPTDEDFWKTATVVMPQSKKTITIRLDADVLAWFKREPGYQTRINAILQAYMKAHE